MDERGGEGWKRAGRTCLARGVLSLWVCVVILVGDGVAPRIVRAQNEAYVIAMQGVDPADCSGGTADQPWKTWAKAESCVPPGSKVYFRAGTYADIFSGSSKNKITFQGEAGNPIEISPYPGEEGQVHIRESLSIRGAHGIIRGIDIEAPGIYSVISVYQAQDVRFEDNHIHGSEHYDCVHIHRDSDSIALVGNEVFDCGMDPNNPTNQGDAIDTTGGVNLIYRANHVHHARDGIQIKGGSRDVLVEGNRIHDVGAAVFGTSMGSLSDPHPQHGNSGMHDPAVPITDRYQALRVTVRNNLVYNTSGFNVFSPRGWVDYAIQNNTVFNHTGSVVVYVSLASWEFFDETALAYCQSHTCGTCTSYSGSAACVRLPLSSRGGEVENNILHTFAGKVAILEAGSHAGLQIGHNLVYAPGFNSSTSNTYKRDGELYSYAQFQALGYEIDSRIAEAEFVDLSNTSQPDLHLSANSPAIDAGRNLPSVTLDFEGNPRPVGSGYDIGAYEYRMPTTFADVPVSHPYHDEIEALYQAGYTAGCGTDPLRYCPDQAMIRAESAVFVGRGIHGTGYEPARPAASSFSDVPAGYWGEGWIEGLWEDGYTAGCGTDPLIYCPLQEHTRAEGCVFYLRMLHGVDYEPPEPEGLFVDVPVDWWGTGWVEAAVGAGLIEPCQEEPELRFCPHDSLSRGLAAYMMVRAKTLIDP